MIPKQYYLGCLAHASYLIGDEKSGVAAVVDPQRDVDQYPDARAQGLRIAHVLLTHFHADFVAGHLELCANAGAKIPSRRCRRRGIRLRAGARRRPHRARRRDARHPRRPGTRPKESRSWCGTQMAARRIRMRS
jgi:glyoxylase-like metal-dependent hydrolase (beta-lactamase superfamily II)